MWECEPFIVVLNIILPASRFSGNFASFIGRLMRFTNTRRGMALEDALQATLDGAVLIALQVQPGAAQASLGDVDPWRQRVMVRLTARAQAGRANRALCAQLAAWLGCMAGDITIVEGQTSRQKRVRVEGMDIDAVLARLSAYLPSGATEDAHA
ncbi:MAG TPA: YggU family protein [Candidatus Poseidoniales archaeon]|nr:MAG TPA: YggU family protein [Candidatus Poseidoniales archaeon]